MSNEPAVHVVFFTLTLDELPTWHNLSSGLQNGEHVGQSQSVLHDIGSEDSSVSEHLFPDQTGSYHTTNEQFYQYQVNLHLDRYKKCYRYLPSAHFSSLISLLPVSSVCLQYPLKLQ